MTSFGRRESYIEDNFNYLGHEKKRVSSTDHQSKVGLCTLLFLRSLRLFADFHLGSRPCSNGFPDYVVLLYRRLDSERFKAVLLQVLHDDRDLEKVYEAFMATADDWQQVRVNGEEEQLDDIYFVLCTDHTDKFKDVYVAEPASRELCDLFTGYKVSQIRNRRKKVSFESSEDQSLPKSLVLCESRMESETMYKDVGEEIFITLNAPTLEMQKIRDKMIKLIGDWWERHREVPYFTKNQEMWKAVVNSRLERLNRKTRDVKSKLGVNFTQACLDRSKTLLDNSPQVELTVADRNQGLLTRFLLHDALQKQLVVDSKTLENNLTECITLWHSFACNGMVVDGSSGLKESTQHELLSVFQSRGDKTLVIITKEPLIGSGWVTSEERTAWADLDSKFQSELLSCAVNVQGTFLPLKEYITQDSTLPQALTVDHVLYLASKPRVIRLGQKIPEIVRYYVERNFSVKRDLDESFFTALEKDTALCAIVGYNLEDIIDKFSNTFVIYSYESLPQKNEIHSTTMVLLHPKDADKYFNEISLRYRCKIYLISYERRRFHFLRTIGGLTTAREHLTDAGEARSINNIWDIDDRNIILSGPSGCGKSTFLKMLCKRAKETHKNILVINVDMRKHRKYLDGKTFDSIHNVKSLLREACLGAETSLLERTLFDYSIEVLGNTVILIDALDETWQSDVENTCLLLRNLVEFIRYEKLVVTTRPQSKSHIEEALNTVASDLPDFSREQQMTLLKQIWDSREVSISEERIGDMTDAASRFTSVPLLAYMLADGAINGKYSPQDIADFPGKVKLFESFIDMRINVFTKKRFELGVSEVKNIRGNLMDLAVASLLKTDSQRSFVLKRTRIEGDDVNGLISSHDGTVVFEHHSFAEFFLGVWFSENFAATRHVLQPLIYDKKFEFVRESLDWCLWKSYSLHSAVVVGDRNAVEKLLSEGAAIVDSGGRTPLHVAATYPGNNDSALWGLLTAAGVSVEQKDEVLGWSAMQYADSVANWEMADFLLDHGSSADELVSLREKSLAKKTLEEACNYGLVNLSKLVLKTYPEIVGESLDGRRGNTALHCAASSGSVKLVSMLLQAGARTDATNALGLSVLCVAALRGKKDVVDFLLSKRTSIRTGIVTPLHSAAVAGHVEVVRCLLAAAVPVDAEDHLGTTPLMAAAANNNAAVVQLLLRQGADTRRQDKRQRTALHWATSTGSSGVAKILVSAGGADVSLVDEGGDTALHLATEKCDMDTLQLLLDHGAKVNTRGAEGRSALHVAVAESKEDVTHLLLENGADVNQEDDAGRTVLHVAHDATLVETLLVAGAAVNARDKQGSTPLHYASLASNQQLAQLLLARGADVNDADKDGRTALMFSASKGDVVTARLLITNRADVNAKDGEGQTAAHYACLEAHSAMVNLLLDNGAQLDYTDNGGRNVILCAAAATSNVANLLPLLLDAGAELTAVDVDGRTAMHWASLAGKVTTVQFLLDVGLEINARDTSNRTALHYASMEGNVQIVTILLKNGAALDIGDKDGVTPLHLAAMHGCADVVRALLDAGAAVDERDDDGNTALHFATLFSGGHLVEFILNAGASVNVANKKGLTSLHKAAAVDNADATRLLLEKGADVTAVDVDAATALHWAATSGAIDVLRLLLNAGADVHAVDSNGLTALHRALVVNNTDAANVLQTGGAELRRRRRTPRPWFFCC